MTDQLPVLDLIAWLRAQLDEDERVARAAVIHGGENWAADSAWLKDMIEPLPSQQRERPGWTPLMTQADADHIARYDPARALRGVAADLTLLDAYERVLSAQGRLRAAAADLDADIATEDRTGVWSGAGFPDVRQRALRREADYLDGMEPVLRTLVRARAAVYADRPGYREEWRPT